MRNPDIIPRKDEDFNTLQVNIVKRTLLKRTAWKIPLAEIELLQQFQTVWKEAWDKAKIKLTRSSVDVAAKNTARKNYEKPLRRFIQVYIQLSNSMSRADKLSCGVKPHSKERKRTAVPDTIPFISYKLAGERIYDFYFHQEQGEEGSSKRRRPDGIERLEMMYCFDEKPKSADDCNKRCSGRRSPFRIQFPVSAKGKTVYFFVRWVNTREEYGKWSKMYQLEI